VIRTWKTKELENVKEHEAVLDGNTTTSVSFQFPDFSGERSSIFFAISVGARHGVATGEALRGQCSPQVFCSPQKFCAQKNLL